MKTNHFKTYDCRYFHDGKWWAVEIMAPDWADAEARVAKLGNLQLQGEVVMVIPARGTGWFVRAYVWLRNLFTSPHP